ncbi:MAG: alpha/beta fold hydrolase [Acidimicrobiales bacterium]
MVFVHGWTCDHTHFTPQADHFSPRHRTVLVDLRGHGHSDAVGSLRHSILKPSEPWWRWTAHSFELARSVQTSSPSLRHSKGRAM